MITVYPHDKENDERLSIFLAGTIDNGDSENWQEQVIENFKFNSKVKFYNPRRKQWDPCPDDSELIYQIHWEQEYLDKADLIIMSISDDSKSPISLLELGLYAKDQKMVVFCNDKFYRYMNVKLTCEKYNIPLYKNSIEEITNFINKCLE